MKRNRFPVVGLTMMTGITAFWIACSGTTGEDTSSSSSSSSSSGAASSSSNGASSSGGEASSGGGGASSSGAAGNGSSSGGGNGGASSSSSGFGGFDAAGFDAAGFDAGFAPYTGEPEDGVVCSEDNETVCTDSTPNCCIGFFSPTQCGPEPCPQGSVAARCDGPEDCTTEGDVCCYQGFSGTSCVTEASCGAGEGDIQGPYRLCNTSADCPAGSGCCYSTALEGYVPEFEAGACIVGCNLEQ